MTFRNRLRVGITMIAVTAALGVGTFAATSSISVAAAGSVASSHAVQPNWPCPGWECNKF
jgi:hypothetical protein